jgi:hypothetical protein
MHWFEDYPVTLRPPYQMSLLFRVAILGSPYQTLGSYDIVEILMAKFPWYNANRYRERTSTSAVQRSRDLNAYWVDQISNMSSKSTNRTWLDKHPFLARMTRGAKGHFWRLQDVPMYRTCPYSIQIQLSHMYHRHTGRQATSLCRPRIASRNGHNPVDSIGDA